MTNTRPTVIHEDQPEDPETTPGMKCGGGDGPADAGSICAANAGKLRAGNAHDGISRDVAPVPVVYQIPIPPSLNNIYFNLPKGGRRKTPEYKAWIAAGLLILKTQKPTLFVERADLNVSVPDSERGDISNRIKAAEDLLVKAGILKGDSKSYVRSAKGVWVAKWLPCQVSLVAA